MKFWVSHSEEVSVREQIATQVTLGIASGELPAGSRLPSTREMARRLHVHANTVSAAYRQLEEEGRVESRRGSGVYVRKVGVGAEGGVAADQLIAALLEGARRSGVTGEELRGGLRRWLERRPADHFLVVEPEAELREIVLAELRDGVSLPVRGMGLQELGTAALRGAAVLVLPSKAASVRAAVGAGTELTVLQITAAPEALAAWLPAPEGALVGICSRWPGFVRLTRTMLVGAGMDPAGLLTRDAREEGWMRGLEATAAVVCDVVVAAQMLSGVRTIPFRLLAEASLVELRRLEASHEAGLARALPLTARRR